MNLGVRIQLWWTLAESEEQANTSQPADLYLDFIYKLEYSGNHKTVVWLSPHSFFCYVMSAKIMKCYCIIFMNLYCNILMNISVIKNR